MTGAYNLHNYAAALAVGAYFAVEFSEMISACEQYAPDNNRSQVVKTANNTLIMDAYNANPSSMEHALINLSRQKGEKYFVIGDMRELGEEGPTEHRKMIELATQLNLSGILIGPVFHSLSNETSFPVFEDNAAARPFLQELNLYNHIILIKGSRGIRLEELKDIF
jgi:UDP-N-acetylmuramoyl-tripeptide--D-alanyl-D-alanine ligase